MCVFQPLRRLCDLLTDAVFVAPTMSPPPKRTQWRENLQNFRRDHGFSTKVLLNCCLVRRVIAWAAPTTKGRNATGSLQDRQGREPSDQGLFRVQVVF